MPGHVAMEVRWRHHTKQTEMGKFNMINRLLQSVAGLVLALAAGSSLAGSVTFSGNLGNSANSALVASDLSAAQFTDDQATANNVALYALHVLVGSNANFTSSGFALGGMDPYFSIFSGTDPGIATWLESNYLHAQTLGGDFSMDVALAPGDYTVAIGVYSNLSFAENLGSGFLADGFIGLGGARYLGDGAYALTVTLLDELTVPEPGSAMLTLTAACAAVWVRRRRRS